MSFIPGMKFILAGASDYNHQSIRHSNNPSLSAVSRVLPAKKLHRFGWILLRVYVIIGIILA